MSAPKLDQRQILENIANNEETTNTDRMKALAQLRQLDRDEGANTQLFRMDRTEIQSKIAALDVHLVDIVG